jgi:hypothetical protein
MASNIRTSGLWITAGLQFAVPAVMVVIGSWILKTDPSEYLRAIFSQGSTLDVVDRVLIFPLGGLAILAARTWSFPVFLATTLLSLSAGSFSSIAFPEIVNMPGQITLHLMNVGLVGYFLLPVVQERYRNAGQKWWENKPRYLISQPGLIYGNWGSSPCQLKDISEGGAFLATERQFSVDENVHVKFQMDSVEYDFEARVAHVFGGVGVQFYLSKETSVAMRSLIKRLDQQKIPKREGRETRVGGLQAWMGRIFQPGIQPTAGRPGTIRSLETSGKKPPELPKSNQKAA